MKFQRRERTTIDAIRWTGDNAVAVNEWLDGLGIPRAAIMWTLEGLDADLTLAALTLHGEVPVGVGAWLAYGGTDCYPLADDELHRLYDEAVSPEVAEFLKPFGDANLGCASTRQLLGEIVARLDGDRDTVRASQWWAHRALDILDDETLDYRTVDS